MYDVWIYVCMFDCLYVCMYVLLMYDYKFEALRALSSSRLPSWMQKLLQCNWGIFPLIYLIPRPSIH
jgi:hypothetical protein